MKLDSVLWVGCGDIGVRTGRSLLAAGWRVAAVRRDVSTLPPGFEPYATDYTRPGSLAFAAELRPDFVVTTFNPANPSEAGYREGFAGAMLNLLQGLGGHRPRYVLMASSTRVFAEREGGWVDEDSPLATDDPRAQAIIDAENLLRDSGLHGSVIRFAGIYGAPGSRLVSRVARGGICPPEPVSYTNRIHREDCAGFIEHLLLRARAGETLLPVYIGVDDAPVPRHEVESWLARELGVPGGAAQRDTEDHSRAGHKRCRNRALHASGYRLRHPDYRSGYGALLAGD